MEANEERGAEDEDTADHLCDIGSGAAAVCLWAGLARICGTMEGYEYCHTDERDRAWEEDILVDQSVEDYKQNVDTVLEYVLAIE